MRRLVVLILLERTTEIVAHLEELRKVWKGEIRFYFVSNNGTMDRALRQLKGVQILYILGHAFDEKLYFPDEKVVPAQSVSKSILRQKQSLQYVLLNCCDGAKTNLYVQLSGKTIELITPSYSIPIRQALLDSLVILEGVVDGDEGFEVLEGWG